ncbi:MAG: cytochrome P450 [Phenylobacterium sp.]
MSVAADPAPLAGLEPPPLKPPSLWQQFGNSGNAFARLPLAYFEKPIVRLTSPFGVSVAVHDPEGVRRVLLDNVANYPKDALSNRIFTAMFGEGLLSAEPEMWRKHRRIMAPAFSPAAVAAYAPAMAKAAAAFADRWSALPAGAEVDMTEEMKAVTLRIICETMFSSDAPELVALAGKALGLSGDGLNFGLLDILPLIGPMRMKAKTKALHDDFSAMDGAIYRMIEERQRNLADAPNDLLTRLVGAKDPEGGPGLTPKEIRDELITIFEAGHETTAVALTFTWYLLSQHPHAEAKLHAELDRVLGGRTAAQGDIEALPYTRQVIEEAMRLFPPAPAVTGRRAAADDEICGQKVARGDRILVSTWVLHRHRTLWDAPETFDPDRFSPERSAGRHRFAYMPFGGGPRICIGMGMAMQEMVLVLATLAQRFEPRLKTPQDIRLSAKITLAPEGGLKMWLERREPERAAAA